MKISLLISLMCHGALLMALQKAVPTKWVPGPMRTFPIEFLRLPVGDVSAREWAKGNLAGVGHPTGQALKATADTITLDTRDGRYSTYAGLIKQSLLRQWRYPRSAEENLIEGDVLVLFGLNRKGQLTGIKILRTSKHGVLDLEAVRAIRSAAPFPTFPESVNVSRLNIRANFSYRLTANR